MPNGDPRDGFFYPTLTLMTYSYKLVKPIISFGCIFLVTTYQLFLTGTIICAYTNFTLFRNIETKECNKIIIDNFGCVKALIFTD